MLSADVIHVRITASTAQTISMYDFKLARNNLTLAAVKTIEQKIFQRFIPAETMVTWSLANSEGIKLTSDDDLVNSVAHLLIFGP